MEENEKKVLAITLIAIIVIACGLIGATSALLISQKKLEQKISWQEQQTCLKHNATLINNQNNLLTCKTFLNEIINVNRAGDKIT